MSFELKLATRLFDRGPRVPIKPDVSAAILAAIFSGRNESTLIWMSYVGTTVLWIRLKTVSYTHLDVYKRQPFTQRRQSV